MKMIKLILMPMLICVVLSACVAPIKTTPLSQAIIPPLEEGKSRVYFMLAGNIGNTLLAKVIDDEKDEVLTYLTALQCTYIDYDPGIHRLRAGHNSLGPNELVTELVTEPGKIYYMIWWWISDRRVGFHGSERGAHFMNLKPKQGKQMINYCNYKPYVIKITGATE